MIKKIVSLPSRSHWVNIRSELSSRSYDSVELASHYWKETIPVLNNVPTLLTSFLENSQSKENKKALRNLVTSLLVFTQTMIEKTPNNTHSPKTSPFENQEIIDKNILKLTTDQKIEHLLYLQDQVGLTPTKAIEQNINDIMSRLLQCH